LLRDEVNSFYPSSLWVEAFFELFNNSEVTVETFIIIGLGGFIGANVRYWVSTWAVAQFGLTFPWGTLIINFTGSLLLAVFIGWAAKHSTIDPRVRLFLAVGFFGAYTTFSTYAAETVALLQTGNTIGAITNILITNGSCIMGALVGLAIGRWL
jgi:fluoride exporter